MLHVAASTLSTMEKAYEEYAFVHVRNFSIVDHLSRSPQLYIALETLCAAFYLACPEADMGLQSDCFCLRIGPSGVPGRDAAGQQLPEQLLLVRTPGNGAGLPCCCHGSSFVPPAHRLTTTALQSPSLMSIRAQPATSILPLFGAVR